MAKKTMQSITNKASYGRRMVPEYLIKKLEEGPVKLKDITNITTLTDDEINSLEAGDIVLKKTGNQYHTYIVSYKEVNQGICLTYTDASCVETVSYDYTDGHWVYNSTDVTSLEKHLYHLIIQFTYNTADDNEEITTAHLLSNSQNITISDVVNKQIQLFNIFNYYNDVPIYLSYDSTTINSPTPLYLDNGVMEDYANSINVETISNLVILQAIQLF